MKFIDKVEKAKCYIDDYANNYNTAVACSFGKDSMVVLHLALQVKPDIQVFSVMTPHKPAITKMYKATMTLKYNLNIDTYENKFSELDDITCGNSPDTCCSYYKVGPTSEAVHNLDAWITGLRRTEGRTRTDYDYVETRSGLIKVNPILDFTELDVWRYLSINEIPVNPLYKEGYRSLGCEPCSRKEEDETETEREGRWSGTSKCGGECGIHTQALR